MEIITDERTEPTEKSYHFIQLIKISQIQIKNKIHKIHDYHR